MTKGLHALTLSCFRHPSHGRHQRPSILLPVLNLPAPLLTRGELSCCSPQSDSVTQLECSVEAVFSAEVNQPVWVGRTYLGRKVCIPHSHSWPPIWNTVV